MSTKDANGKPQNGLTNQQISAFNQSIPAIGVDGTSDMARMTAGDLVDSLFRLGGVQVEYTTNGTAGTADAVTHNLGRTPVGYVVVQNGNGGVVYNGGASGAFSATNSTLSLKCTTASNPVTLYVF